jgi:putative aminopeptidase FrvX
MNPITPFLKELLTAPGLSGYEDPAAEIISAKWKPLVDEISRGKLGSLHGLRRGTGPGPHPALMVATHMDAIGLMVTGIKDGFLRLTQVGGIDPRILPGALVTLHATGSGGQQSIPAVVVLPQVRLLPPEIGLNPVPLEYLFLDTGLPLRVKWRVLSRSAIWFHLHSLPWN